MEITKELLEERISQAETRRERLLAGANAADGAVLIIRSLLADLAAEEPDAEEPDVDSE